MIVTRHRKWRSALFPLLCHREASCFGAAFLKSHSQLSTRTSIVEPKRKHAHRTTTPAPAQVHLAASQRLCGSQGTDTPTVIPECLLPVFHSPSVVISSSTSNTFPNHQPLSTARPSMSQSPVFCFSIPGKKVKRRRHAMSTALSLPHSVSQSSHKYPPL